MDFLIDYLTFVLKDFNVEHIQTFLHIDIPSRLWAEGGKKYGYQSCMFYNNIRIYYNGTRSQGVCVSMSGEGCRAYESITDFTFLQLFNQLMFFGSSVNITRLDVACDEREGILKLPVVVKYTRNESFTKRLREWVVTYSNKGCSVAIGSRSSNIMVRIYDKAAERSVGGHWIRVELQLRDELATGVMEHILKYKDIGAVFVGVLNYYLRFIEKTDVNISRCSTTKWWNKFLVSAEKIKILTIAGVEYNYQKLDCYVRKHISKNLFTWLVSNGSNAFLELEHMLMSVSGDLSKKQKVVISQRVAEGKTDGNLILENKMKGWTPYYE